MPNRTPGMRVALAAAVGLVCLFTSPINWTWPQASSLITQAEARVGRPLTPGSVAGVARRTTRRTVRRGAYYGAAGAAVGASSYYYNGYNRYRYDGSGGCYRGTNAYGRVVMVCR